MKKFFKITGIFILSVLFVLYLAFLFVLPNQIDLNKYKPDLQKLVKENTDLTYLDSFIKYVKILTKQQEENLTQNIGKNIASEL